MLLVTAIFLAIMSLICGAYGFTEIQNVTRTVSRVLFGVFLAAAVILFIID